MAILEDLPEDSSRVGEDIRKMQVSLAETGKGSLRGLFQKNDERLLNRTFLAMFSTFFQQMNGIGIIGFYTTTIYSDLLGLSPITARVLSACTYVFQLGCSFIAFATIDRVGRRALMMFGTIGMGIMFIVVAGTVAHASGSRACAGIAATCVFLIAMFFAIGGTGHQLPLRDRSGAAGVSRAYLCSDNDRLVVLQFPGGGSHASRIRKPWVQIFHYFCRD